MIKNIRVVTAEIWVKAIEERRNTHKLQPEASQKRQLLSRWALRLLLRLPPLVVRRCASLGPKVLGAGSRRPARQ